MSNEGFTQEFLEEAKEHLRSIHMHLLALENSVLQEGQGEHDIPRYEAIDQLFRSFHTLKGLSGMIGLQTAAQLSHGLETVLLSIQKTRIEANEHVLQALFEGTQKLEAVIGSLTNSDAPEIDVAEQVQRLEALLPPQIQTEQVSSEAAPPPDAAAPEGMFLTMETFLQDILGDYPNIRANLNDRDNPILIDAALKGRYLWLCTFTPTAEWTKQGINVAQIRQELSKTGTLIKAIPLVSGVGVQFTFLIATQKTLDRLTFPYLECTLLLPGRNLLEEPPFVKPRMSSSASNVTDRSFQTNLVRVDMKRLDDLVQMVGDLVIQRSVLADRLKELSGIKNNERRDLTQTMAQMDRTMRHLRDAVLRTRMVPLSDVFNQMPLAVRDLARSTGKDVQLILEGADTEIDKALIDRLFEPLLHLVRNAVTHGLEDPEERLEHGKPERGRLVLRGRPEGDHIIVEVSDDGRGIDREKVVKRAQQSGIIDHVFSVTDSEVLDILCHPGFSTQETADLMSGRGVGMDVVRRAAARLNGALSLSSEEGSGATFSLRLPLSLVILDAVLVRCENELFAIPQGLLEEVVQIDLHRIVQAESGELYPLQDDALAIIRLAKLFGLPPAEPERSPRSYCYGLIGTLSDRRAALLVDRLIGLREIVVRPVADPLVTCPGVSGAAELGNGQVVLILNPNELLEDAKRKRI
jgi:two-component system, chemotaxis family, sensor kinase CheA